MGKMQCLACNYTGDESEFEIVEPSDPPKAREQKASARRRFAQSRALQRAWGFDGRNLECAAFRAAQARFLNAKRYADGPPPGAQFPSIEPDGKADADAVAGARVSHATRERRKCPSCGCVFIPDDESPKPNRTASDQNIRDKDVQNTPDDAGRENEPKPGVWYSISLNESRILAECGERFHREMALRNSYGCDGFKKPSDPEWKRAFRKYYKATLKREQDNVTRKRTGNAMPAKY